MGGQPAHGGATLLVIYATVAVEGAPAVSKAKGLIGQVSSDMGGRAANAGGPTVVDLIPSGHQVPPVIAPVPVTA